MDNPYDSAFPNKIDLGREVPDYGDGPCAATADVAEDDGKQKTRTVYPGLYISGVDAVKDLPEDGWALIRFHRTGLSTRETNRDGDSKTEVSADLDVCEMCLPEPDDDKSLAELFAEFMKNRPTD